MLTDYTIIFLLFSLFLKKISIIEIGVYHQLSINRTTPQGLYLVNEKEEEVLLPNKYVPEQYEIGDLVNVFVYLDHDERHVATTLQPKVQVDEFSMLTCLDANEYGAFMDWGLEKQLFVPYAEQRQKMKIGESYLVFCFLDEQSDRLAASSKVNHFTDNKVLTVEEKDAVDFIVADQSDLGYQVIINDIHLGLLYYNEVFEKLQIGDRRKGYIKTIRDDNKIDVNLEKFSYQSIEPNSDKIYKILKENDGYLPYHDKSPSDAIHREFKMSKKAFKNAIGNLYKHKVITIKKGDGIYLK